MKYFIILLAFFLTYGCDDAYPKEERHYTVIDVYNKEGIVDSITLYRDTIRVYRSNLIKDATYVFFVDIDSTQK